MTGLVASTFRTRPSAGNDDRYLVRAIEGALLVVVADGAGGSGGGGRAADLVIDALFASRHPLTEAGLCRALEVADSVIDEDPMGGETTGVVVAVWPERLVGASVGDSACWLWTGEALLDLSEDQVRKPLLGSGRASATPFSCALPPHGLWSLLVASDGVSKYARWEVVKAAIGDRGKSARDLANLARLPSGTWQDDATACLVRLALA